MNITGEATKGFGVITSGTEKLENFTVIPYIIEESVQTNTTNSDSDTTQSADNTETEAN